jgi:hypothetical protein
MNPARIAPAFTPETAASARSRSHTDSLTHRAPGADTMGSDPVSAGPGLTAANQADRDGVLRILDPP